jgi:hypothetical protein
LGVIDTGHAETVVAKELLDACLVDSSVKGIFRFNCVSGFPAATFPFLGNRAWKAAHTT